ncbi:hypothetical protein HJD18_03105 [Thermoleophilia bacterium SCSIO 60948]|nr:hypothetical protein HJD18_03105 [Thermoleophilia bacterium SCSIO 60948]
METKKRRRLPSPAMLVAIVALVAALGGSAYAAAMITSKDIKDNTIRSADIKTNGVKGKDVAEGTLGKVPAARVADRVRGGIPDPNEDNDQVRWFLLGENGTILDQSGGFTVQDAYDTNANAYIDAGEDLSGKGFSATIAIQNQVDTTADGNTDGAADPNFAGEVSVAKCNIPGAVACAPPGTNVDTSLVVSPRNSDGTPAATTSPGSGPGTATKRVYVTVTETNDDYTEGR